MYPTTLDNMFIRWDLMVQILDPVEDMVSN